MPASNAERAEGELPMKLVEIHREDIETLPDLMATLRADRHRWIVFCDDLSFDGDDTSYKSLKTALDGGIEGRPENVLFYATSNRRHLLARDMVENERSTAINPGEAVEEKVSLSGPVRPLARLPQVQPGRVPRHDPCLCRAVRTEGRPGYGCGPRRWNGPPPAAPRSGRTAFQFIQDLAGRLGRRLE